jgi:type II secretory pathway pseudopilin PulG
MTRRTRRHRRHRRGFYMLEMLFVLTLLGTVAYAGEKLFESTLRAGQAAARAQNDANSFDTAVATLRADTWAAGIIESSDPKHATLKLPGERAIAWSLEGDSLTRTEANQPPRRWTITDGSTFTALDFELVLRIPRTKTSRGGEVRLPAQVLLIRRLAP